MADKFLDIGGIAVAEASLTIGRARDVAAVFARQVLDYAALVECRSRNSGKEEILIVDVEVERPQLCTYDVHASERVAIVFYQDDRRPDVLSLRPDFPSVPHLNLSLTEYPKSLCLYEQLWTDVVIGWTPARFIERIRYWFAETAKGTLHKTDQPLEPLIVSTGYQIIIPADLFTAEGKDELQRLNVALLGDREARVLRAFRPTAEKDAGLPYIGVVLTAEPQTHGVIRNSPANLNELHHFLANAGLDLLGKLRSNIELWADKPNLKARLIIIVACPKVRDAGKPIEATDVWSFLTVDTVEQVLTAIGRRASGGGILIGPPKDDEQGQTVALEVLRTYYSLSRSMAAFLNGHDEASDCKTVAVGLGALGSKVQANLARSGFGTWTLVDDDELLPHNIARHALTGEWAGYKKVQAARVATQPKYDDAALPTEICADVLAPKKQKDALDKAFAEAELILDMSASVSVARHLASVVKVGARRVSVFLNPAGCELVVLAEDSDRKTPLDALEFQLYRAIVNDERLHSHLTTSTGVVRYASSCRDITSRVPDDQVSLLAAAATRAIWKAAEDKTSHIKLWQLDPATFGVTPVSVPTSPVHQEEIHGWTLITDNGLHQKLQALRAEKLPNETGGVLLGHFDHAHRRAYVVDMLPSPPDSKEWPTLYVRGAEGLMEQIERVRTLTAGNLEYMGEWHSHPVGCSARPSNDDMKAFASLTRHMDDEGQPALMAIVADAGPCFYLCKMIWKAV